MIEMKDLILRRYNKERKCIEFTYDLILNDGFIQSFKFKQLSNKVWKIDTVYINCDYKSLTYDLPRENMDLIIIAAIGLNYFRLTITEEIQYKQNVEFTIGEIIQGIIG